MTETTRLLRDLVRIPSINPMGRSLSGPEYLEHRVTAFLEQFLRELGVPFQRQRVAAQRENIVARFDSHGSKRTILFEAHQDTVPVEGMTIDPFGAKIEDGKLYGRGACDIKGGLAAMLSAFARLSRERPGGAASVVLACVVDEEFTFTGITELVKSWPMGKPTLAVVAEPTALAVVNAHKGVVRWRLHTTGRSCHSSSPERGINAIYRMGKVLAGIEQFAEVLRKSRRDPLLGPPTVSVGRIEGGLSVNTVPERCRIEVDRRLIPGEDGDDAPRELAGFLRDHLVDGTPFDMDAPWMCKAALSPAGSEELVARLGAAIDAVCGRHRVMGVPYGTDAPTVAEAGVPAVVFGPGDIAQAHTCDEWVSLEQVEQASEILYRLATQEAP